MQDPNLQRAPGEHIRVDRPSSGVPFAMVGIGLGAVCAWKVLSLLPAMVGAAVDCANATLQEGSTRTLLIACVLGGIAAVVLSEVAARREMGKLRVLCAVGSVLGVASIMFAAAILAVTLFSHDIATCVFGATAAA